MTLLRFDDETIARTNRLVQAKNDSQEGLAVAAVLRFLFDTACIVWNEAGDFIFGSHI